MLKVSSILSENVKSIPITFSLAGLRVGQATIHRDPDIHTGVTIIFPRDPVDTYFKPCYGATHNLNGVGELTGCHCLKEWGFLRSVITRVPKMWNYTNQLSRSRSQTPSALGKFMTACSFGAWSKHA